MRQQENCFQNCEYKIFFLSSKSFAFLIVHINKESRFSVSELQESEMMVGAPPQQKMSYLDQVKKSQEEKGCLYAWFFAMCCCCCNGCCKCCSGGACCCCP